MFVKIGDFIKFKGFLVEIPREQALLRKSKASRKVDFSEPRLLQCT